MEHSEEYYKMKYLKYKYKYFELKHKLEGGDGELELLGRAGQGVGRIFKKVGKSILGSIGVGKVKSPKEERLEIRRIINKYNLTDGVKKNEKGEYEVRSFLDNLHKKIKEATDDTIKKDLNYVLGKHYMCKGMSVSAFWVYDQKDCFEETETTTATNK